MRKALLPILLLMTAMTAQAAKAPKWLKKSHNAVCTITTYDAKGTQVSQGAGFFLDADGTGIADYSLFLGAKSAVTTDAAGVQRPITRITGASSLYDVVRFRVEPDKKMIWLQVADTLTVGESLYIMPYYTEKSGKAVETEVSAASAISDEARYYTLTAPNDSALKNLPAVNAMGQVVGIVQTGSYRDTICYALDWKYLKSLKITALTLNTADYLRLDIPMALPQEKDQALTYVYLMNDAEPEVYNGVLEDFINTFPESSEGYYNRAAYIVQSHDSTRYDLALADLERSVKLAEHPDEAHVNYGNLIYQSIISDAAPRIDGWTLEKALEETVTGIDINPAPSFLTQKGNIEFAMKRYEDCFGTFAKVCTTQAATAETYYFTAMVKEIIGDDSGVVIAYLDSAINFYGKPYTAKVAPYVMERAMVKERQEMHREAIVDLNLYEEIMGSGVLSADFYLYREQAEIKTRMYEQALRDAERAAEVAPDDDEVKIELASMYLRVNYFEKALPLLERLIKVYPDNTDCRRLAGVCYMRLGKKDQACDNLQAAKQLGDTLVDELIEQNCR